MSSVFEVIYVRKLLLCLLLTSVNADVLRTRSKETEAASDVSVSVEAAGSFAATADGSRRIMRSALQPASQAEVARHGAYVDSSGDLPFQAFQAPPSGSSDAYGLDDVEKEYKTLQATIDGAGSPSSSTQSPTPTELDGVQQASDFNSSPVKPDCHWYTWSPWSHCSKSCGQGIRNRKRSVAIGVQCEGVRAETEQCSLATCPVDCIWGNWTSWSDCSASCGGGVRQRERPILQQGNAQGQICDLVDGVQRDGCNLHRCSSDCAWDTWSAWSTCSRSCGAGTKQRQRSVKLPSIEDGKECEGNSTETASCSVEVCPVDCIWGSWNPWEPCAASCGNGTQTRKRAPEVTAEGAGLTCPGPSEQQTPCWGGECPVDCVWGDWSSWSGCTVSCGGADSISTSSRNVSRRARSGGKSCEGDPSRTQACGREPCPVDCKMGDWSEWETCSKTCGGGLSSRSRAIAVAAQNGGSECEDTPLNQNKSCSTDLCPINCQVSDWSPWTECSNACGNGTHMRFRAEERPAARGGKRCPGRLQDVDRCVGSDCVPTADLIKSGAAEQITGAFQIATQDALAFAANPLSQVIAQQALRKLIDKPGSEPARRVHVSLQPSFRKSNQLQNVNVWYSVVIPSSANVSFVSQQLSMSHSTDAARALRASMQSAGMLDFIKITKLVSSPTTTTSTTTTPSPDAVTTTPERAENATRVMCMIKMVVPQPVLFSVHKMSTQALVATIGDLTKMPNSSIHVAMMPGFVAKAKSDQQDKVDEQALDAQMASQRVAAGPRGELNSWLSITYPPGPKGEVQLDDALELAKALEGEDPAVINSRLEQNLKDAGIPSWSNSEVTSVQCQSSQSQQTAQEDIADAVRDRRVTGVLRLTVQNPRSFCEDYRAKKGIRKALSVFAEVTPELVMVSLIPSKYDASLLAENDSDSDVNANDIDAWYVISVTATDEQAERLRMGNLDRLLAELKLQNFLLDEDFTETVRIASISVDGAEIGTTGDEEPQDEVKEGASEVSGTQ